MTDTLGAIDHEPCERSTDRHPVDGIELACRCVKNEDRCIFQEGAGNGDTLALAAGKPDATLSNAGFETVSEACHDIIERGVGDGLQCAAEEEGVLGNQDRAGSEIIETVAPGVIAIACDVPLAKVPDSHQRGGPRFSCQQIIGRASCPVQPAKLLHLVILIFEVNSRWSIA